MKYFYSDFWTIKAKEIARKLSLEHIDLERISVIKSSGSKTKRTVARIHTFGKVLQIGMQQKAFYAIELLTEEFDKQSEEEKTKTLIHELLHIPRAFGGGFRNHRQYVNKISIEKAFNKLQDQTRISD